MRTFEARFLAQNGVPFYFSTNMTPIIESGHVAGVGISRDINERIKLEQQITDLKNFQENILKSIQAGLITIDLQGRISSFNAGAEEVLNYDALEALGQPLEQVMGSEAAAIFLQPVPRGEFPTNREMPLKTRAGNDIYIGFTVTPRLDDQGSRVGTIISFKDISQIKRMQAEVIRMDRLASLGVLASGMAHEIKNPLAGIKAMAQTLQEEFADGDDRQIIWNASCVRSTGWMNCSKRFSIMRGRGRRCASFTAFRTSSMKCSLWWIRNCRRSNIRGAPLLIRPRRSVYVDFHQIQQVILNLIFNAVDAIEDGGKLRCHLQPPPAADQLCPIVHPACKRTCTPHLRRGHHQGYRHRHPGR